MNCDSIAPIYWLLERCAFGPALQNRRRRFLGDVQDGCQILALGDGDGRALADLLRACPHAHVDYVDLSPRMLHEARRRVGDSRVTFHCANALTFASPPGHYDLVVTHFFLDCLDEDGVTELAARMRNCAAPTARWVISEFQAHSMWTRAAVGFLYLFFSLTTGLRVQKLVDYAPILERHGFRRMGFEQGCGGLLVSELWAAAPDAF